jgi:MFS family permease
MSGIRRLVKFALLQSILGSQIDFGISFSLPTNSLISGSLRTSLSPSDSLLNPYQLHIGSSNHRGCLFANNVKNSGDIETLDGDETKIQNWLLALVVPLQLVYVSNQLTRSSIYYLVDFSGGNGDAGTPDPFRAMNVDIGFSEAQYGLLASLAFTSLFAVASLGAGAAADKYDRKTLTVLSAVGWSVAIIGTSFSTDFNEVLFWRIAMGLFCAFSTPTAYTLITEKVPKDRLSLATSIYGTGVACGGALASLSILLDNQVGWSQTCLSIGLVGVICAFVVGIVVPSDDFKSFDDISGAATDVTSKPIIDDDNVNQSYSFIDGLSEAFSTSRAKWIFGASFLRFSSGLCIGVWSAPFFRAAFPDNASEYAVAQALITAVAGSASGLAGGAAADYLSTAMKTNDEENANEDLLGRRLWIPVAGSLLAAPTWYLAIHSTESFQIAMLWLTIEYLVAECWFGPTISTLLSTVPSKIGGTAQGMFTLTGAIANLSPTLLGYLYGQASSFTSTTDGVEASTEVLPVLLTYGVCFGYVSSAFCFAMGARSAPALDTTAKLKSN